MASAFSPDESQYYSEADIAEYSAFGESVNGKSFL
jgi:hypothetical protein